MATRKHKALTPDKDGFLNTGIYRRRVVPKKQTPDEKDAAFDALLELAGKPPQPIREWLAEYRRALCEYIRPHLEAIDREEWRRRGGRCYPLNLGDGKKAYVLKDGLATETTEFVEDTIDALHQIKVMEYRIGDGDVLRGSLADVVKAAWELGRAQERALVRRFEPLVRERKRSRKGLEGHNANKPSSDALRRQAEAAIAEVRQLHPEWEGRRGYETTIRKRAAKKCGISLSALNKRLKRG